MTIEPPKSINSFRDAVGLALRVADEFAFANAVAVLDADGSCRSLAMTSGIGASAEPLLRWLTTDDRVWLPAKRPPRRVDGTDPIERSALGPVPASLLVVSVGELDPSVIRECDLERYRRAQRTAGRRGLRLLDWMATDGDAVRSYAYLVDPIGAWPADPPDDRCEDSVVDGPP